MNKNDYGATNTSRFTPEQLAEQLAKREQSSQLQKRNYGLLRQRMKTCARLQQGAVGASVAPVVQPRPAQGFDIVAGRDSYVAEGSRPVVFDLLGNDTVAGGGALAEGTTAVMPSPHVLDYGTISKDATGAYVYTADEGAVGTDDVGYYIRDADGAFIGSGSVTIEANNPLSLKATAPDQSAPATNQWNYTVTGPDGQSEYVSSGPVVALDATSQQAAQDAIITDLADHAVPDSQFTPNGGMLHGYREKEEAREVIDNGDGTTTVRITVLSRQHVGGNPDQPGGAEYREGSVVVEYTLTLDGSSTGLPVSSNPALSEIDLTSVLDVPVGNDGEYYLEAIDGQAVTDDMGHVTNDQVVLESGATVTYDHAAGTFSYEPAAGATGTDSFTVSVTDGDWTRVRTIEINALGQATATALPAARRDTVLMTQDTLADDPSVISTEYAPLQNDMGATGLTVTNVTYQSGDPSVTATIVDNQIVFSAPAGTTGTATFSYEVTDETGATSMSYVDVELSEYSEAEHVERGFASERLGAIANGQYEGLEVTENDDGTFTFKVEAEGIEFTVAADALGIPPTFIQEMLSETAWVGASQAAEQFNGGAQHFDLADPAQKALYEMFIRVGGVFGIHRDPSGGALFRHEPGGVVETLFNDDTIFAEMGALLFDSKAGKDWFVGNLDSVVSSLTARSGTDGFTGGTAEDVLNQMYTFLGASDPEMLTKADGTALSVEEKDVVMSVMLDQIGFLGSNQDSVPGEDAVNEGIDLLVEYAADIYALDALTALQDDIQSFEYEVDIGALFNGASMEEIHTAIETGQYQDLGMTDEQFFDGISTFLYTAAKAGLEIRAVIETPGEVSGLLGAFADMFKDVPVPPTDVEIRTYVSEVVTDMQLAMAENPAARNDMMGQFYRSLDTVAADPRFSKFKGASGSVKSYSRITSGKLGGGGVSDALGGFTTILVLGTAGLSGKGFWQNGDPAEITAVAGWMSLLITGGAGTVNSLLGPVTTNVTNVNPTLAALDDLLSQIDEIEMEDTLTGPKFRGRVNAQGMYDDLDVAVDDIGKLLKTPAVQSMRSLRGMLQATGIIAAPVGTALIGTSLALQAKEQTDVGIKVAQGATAGLWLTASAGFAVSGAVGIAKSLGVPVSSMAAKVGAVAGKVANVAARVTAAAFGIVGALQNVKAQKQFIDLWDIMMQPGGPDNEAGFYVQEQFRDLEPMSAAGAGVAGFLLGVLGGPVVVGFNADDDFHDGEQSEDWGMWDYSDVRLKRDIRKVGFDARLNLPIYSWRYITGDPARYVGVMAQELLARPDLRRAVRMTDQGPLAGFYAVNYAALGLRFIPEDEYRAAPERLSATHPRNTGAAAELAYS